MKNNGFSHLHVRPHVDEVLCAGAEEFITFTHHLTAHTALSLLFLQIFLNGLPTTPFFTVEGGKWPAQPRWA
jgi:hypothetical protein